MTIELPIVPPTTTAQQKRVRLIRGRRGKVVPAFFKSDALEQAESDYLILLQQHRPPAPLQGPLELSVAFVWPHLASTPARLRGQEIPKVTRPDADNLVKQLTDCLVKLQFLYDDSQIARLVATKLHGPVGCVRIGLIAFEGVS